ncbi:MAG: glycosyltransferase family 39 protein [Planctomycetota bacterium]
MSGPTAAPPLAPPTGTAPTPRTAWVVAALVLACLPYLVGLGAPPLWDANEPLYAEPPREALETGDWLAPPWNYKPWFVRPPLSSWATMAGYAVAGVNETGARLAGAWAAVGTLLATFALGAALGGRRVGLLAAAVLAATPRVWLFSRQLPGDVWMTTCLVAGFAAAVPTLRGDPRGRRRLLLGHACVAVGVLAKGPVILGLYTVPLALAARFGRPRVAVRDLRPFALAGLVLALAGPWFAYMAWRYGVPYVRDFFGWHHVRRAISDDVGARPPWYMLQAVLGDGQPWVLLAPFALRAARRRGDRDPVGVLAWAGALFPLVFFSIPFGKRNVYLLPCYPMLAAALAPFLASLLRGGHPRLVRAAGALAAAAAATGTTFLALARAHVPADVSAAALPFLVGLPVAGAVAAFGGLRRRAAVVVGVLVVAPWAATLASAALLPALGRYMPVPRLAAALVAEARPGDPAVVYGVGIHSLMFYARRPTVTAHNPAELLAAVPPGGRAYALGEEDELGEVPKHAPLRLTEVARAPQFRFHFGRNVLGHGDSVRDLVLVRVERTADGAGEGAAPGPR